MVLLFSDHFGEGVGARHVLRVSCHFQTRSRGGVIIYEKRIISSFPTMSHIQTFITHYQDLQDASARQAKTSRRIQKRRQDLQDDFAWHAPISGRLGGLLCTKASWRVFLKY